MFVETFTARPYPTPFLLRFNPNREPEAAQFCALLPPALKFGIISGVKNVMPQTESSPNAPANIAVAILNSQLRGRTKNHLPALQLAHGAVAAPRCASGNWRRSRYAQASLSDFLPSLRLSWQARPWVYIFICNR